MYGSCTGPPGCQVEKTDHFGLWLDKRGKSGPGAV